MTSKIIEQAWEGFRAAVLASDLSQPQLEHCRVIFYGGATAMFSALFGGLSEGDDVTPEDEQAIAALHEELEVFANETALRIAQPFGKPS